MPNVPNWVWIALGIVLILVVFILLGHPIEVK